MVDQSEWIRTACDFVKAKLADAEPGHDWWHAYRVWKVAMQIAEQEAGSSDLMVVQLAALLHDIADAKFHDGDELIGGEVSALFLRELGVDPERVYKIAYIIDNMSFKGGVACEVVRFQEFDIVQDADRLDAMGAMGIARAFSYGGFRGRPFYDPAVKPMLNMGKEEYRKSTAPTVNHFYEKLFKLKNLMNTEAGRIRAAQRHEFMEQYLDQFYGEWEGER